MFVAIQFTFSQHKNLIMLFLFVSCYVSNFLIISIVKEKIRAKIAPATPIGASTTLTEDLIQTPPLVALKTIKILSL